MVIARGGRKYAFKIPFGLDETATALKDAEDVSKAILRSLLQYNGVKITIKDEGLAQSAALISVLSLEPKLTPVDSVMIAKRAPGLWKSFVPVLEAFTKSVSGAEDQAVESEKKESEVAGDTEPS